MWLGCCISIQQRAFKLLRAGGNIKLFKGLPSKEEFETMLESFGGHHYLVILDDSMAEMAQVSWDRTSLRIFCITGQC